jgi:hypothetical protein
MALTADSMSFIISQVPHIEYLLATGFPFAISNHLYHPVFAGEEPARLRARSRVGFPHVNREFGGPRRSANVAEILVSRCTPFARACFLAQASFFILSGTLCFFYSYHVRHRTNEAG